MIAEKQNPAMQIAATQAAAPEIAAPEITATEIAATQVAATQVAARRSVEPVLILGAGINGAALARELALNGVGVVIVDRRDVASGATSASSRLIHGGLRYLEYREFDLVRESLAERTRLLRLAPQFVRPLRLFIPLDNRSGGLMAAAREFLGLKAKRSQSTGTRRGLWPVSIGLSLYDAYARDPTLERRKLFHVGSPEAIPVDPKKFRWAYAYSDAQAIYPERLSLAMLEDARRTAEQAGISFRLFTYHQASLHERTVDIAPLSNGGGSGFSFNPSAIINATGAWVDRTLAALDIASPRLIGGTKGSHFLTYHAGLRERLAGRGVYVEAADGRPIFVLPFGSDIAAGDRPGGTLVGTTDLVYDDDPAQAVASAEELQYLLDAVNALFADLRLSAGDIEMHYCGVRPLPFHGPQTPASVTRRHLLQVNSNCALPFYSIIGGKLTTCRSLAEETAATILTRLGLPPTTTSRDRLLPGAEGYPADPAALEHERQRLAERFCLPRESIEVVWSLIGARTAAALAAAGCDAKAGGEADRGADRKMLADVPLPRAFVRWVVENEWVATLEDLIERRLMLLYRPNLSRQAIADLASVLVECGRLPQERIEAAMDAAIDRLRSRYGKKVSN